MHSTAEKERAGKQVAAEFVGKTAAEALDPVAIMAVATKQRCELNRALKLLARARKELHLIREKDSRAVYDTTVRIQSDAFLSHYLKTKGEQTVSTNVMSTSGSAELTTSMARYPLFDLRILVDLDGRFNVFLAHCLETGSVATADDRDTVVSMIKELLEDEISFAIKHENLRNMFSSPAPLEVWKKFTQASAQRKPETIKLNIQTNLHEPETFVAQLCQLLVPSTEPEEQSHV